MIPAKLYRSSWLLYDFAKNSFSTVIVTFFILSISRVSYVPGWELSAISRGGVNGSLSLIVVALFLIAGPSLLLRIEEPPVTSGTTG